MEKAKARVIRASEVGQYQYCARAWWLGSVQGEPSVNTFEMARGEAVHRWHGRAVWASHILTLAALALVALALVALALLALILVLVHAI